MDCLVTLLLGLLGARLQSFHHSVKLRQLNHHVAHHVTSIVRVIATARASALASIVEQLLQAVALLLGLLGAHLPRVVRNLQSLHGLNGFLECAHLAHCFISNSSSLFRSVNVSASISYVAASSTAHRSASSIPARTMPSSRSHTGA